MRMTADHDYHLHTYLSRCSRDPEQTVDALIGYARTNRLRHICVTDHFWDADVPGASAWYQGQDLPHIRQSLPLPSPADVRVSFGAEADMDRHLTLGLTRAHWNEFAFVNVAISHLHMPGFTRPVEQTDPAGRAEALLRRLDALLAMPLPFRKTGIAHLTTPHLGHEVPGGYLAVLNLIDEDAWAKRLMRVAMLGCGIELNIRAVYPEEPCLRPYRVAKACGCKFFLGSDAHHPAALATAKEQFEAIIDMLALRETDKFCFPDHS